MSSRSCKFGFEPTIFRKTEITSNCKILTDYAKESYRKNEISKELYANFINYIIPLCLERTIEEKFNEIIPRWNKRFNNWFYPNTEEAS